MGPPISFHETYLAALQGACVGLCANNTPTGQVIARVREVAQAAWADLQSNPTGNQTAAGNRGQPVPAGA